jgi:hypothetical protein
VCGGEVAHAIAIAWIGCLVAVAKLQGRGERNETG